MKKEELKNKNCSIWLCNNYTEKECLEKNLEKIFQKASSEVRSVLFFDEADALLQKNPGGSTVMQRVIPTLKNLLSGVLSKQDVALVVVAATNAPWDIDPSFLRPGRFDFKKYVKLPDENERIELLKLNLEDIPNHITDEGLKRVASKCEGFSGADIQELVKLVCNDCFLSVIDKHPELSEIAPDEELDLKLLDPVTAENLIACVEKRIKASVQPDSTPRYEEFQSRWSQGENRCNMNMSSVQNVG